MGLVRPEKVTGLDRWWRAHRLRTGTGEAGSTSTEHAAPDDAPRAAPGDGKQRVRGRRPAAWRPRSRAVVLVAAGLAGSIPFSNLAARLRAGVDLRDVGTGTVSGTALFDVAGFGALAVAGVCDVAKGAVGPVLAGPERPRLAAAATAAGVAAHNWSPWLRGAGGRGISPALGATVVRDWPGTVTLALGLAGGRLARQTGLGSFLADLALIPVLHRTRGRAGVLMGAAIVVPLLAKRLMGNHRPARRGLGVYMERLVFDRDPDGLGRATR
ncbi:MAG TPA: glycerol-3-phosphate acyltransferase [Acidimicrobiales bacterium]